MNADPLEAEMRHGHRHRWCSQACKDNDCEFGPCCVTSDSRSADRVWVDALRAERDALQEELAACRAQLEQGAIWGVIVERDAAWREVESLRTALTDGHEALRELHGAIVDDPNSKRCSMRVNRAIEKAWRVLAGGESL